MDPKKTTKNKVSCPTATRQSERVAERERERAARSTAEQQPERSLPAAASRVPVRIPEEAEDLESSSTATTPPRLTTPTFNPLPQPTAQEDAPGRRSTTEVRNIDVGTSEDQDSDQALVASGATAAGATASSSSVWPGRKNQAFSKLIKDDPSSVGVPKVRHSLASDSGVGGPSDTLLQSPISDSFLGGLLQSSSKDQAVARSGRETVKACLSPRPPGRFGALNTGNRTQSVPDLSETFGELERSSSEGDLDINVLDFSLGTTLGFGSQSMRPSSDHDDSSSNDSSRGENNT